MQLTCGKVTELLNLETKIFVQDSYKCNHKCFPNKISQTQNK